MVIPDLFGAPAVSMVRYVALADATGEGPSVSHSEKRRSGAQMFAVVVRRLVAIAKLEPAVQKRERPKTGGPPGRPHAD